MICDLVLKSLCYGNHICLFEDKLIYNIITNYRL